MQMPRYEANPGRRRLRAARWAPAAARCSELYAREGGAGPELAARVLVGGPLRSPAGVVADGLWGLAALGQLDPEDARVGAVLRGLAARGEGAPPAPEDACDAAVVGPAFLARGAAAGGLDAVALCRLGQAMVGSGGDLEAWRACGGAEAAPLVDVAWRWGLRGVVAAGMQWSQWQRFRKFCGPDAELQGPLDAPARA
ncbi:unnamed protein product [Pedinophyceae sp. YPF-701]|nr:unnamed protein product [Pedinophyceae sp. YPF-701]